MRQHFHRFAYRHETRNHSHHHIKSGIGAVLAMLAVGALTVTTGVPLLIAPFGASAVLLFGQPRSPLAQPVNAIGGYLLAAIVVAIAAHFFPEIWWAAAIGVGVTIAGMSLLRVTHPPAGAVPLVAFGSHLDPMTLLLVVLIGSVLLVMIAVVHHAIPPSTQYPIPIPAPAETL